MIKVATKSLLVSLLLCGLTVSLGWASTGSAVVISEVAWSGTQASWADEWIELRNLTEEKMDLAGWVIAWGDTKIHLGKEKGDTVRVTDSVIDPGGVLLLERTDDQAVSSVKADLIFKGSLSNSGEELSLKDDKGQVVQVVDGSEGWKAGTSSDGEPGYASMVLVEGEWKTHQTKGNQKDSEGSLIYGSPGSPPEESA